MLTARKVHGEVDYNMWNRNIPWFAEHVARNPFCTYV